MTDRSYQCTRCRAKSGVPGLFDALRLLANLESVPPCGDCGGARNLHLRFDFGLHANNPECVVVRSFLPEELVSWTVNNSTTHTFFPFLVVLERTDDRKLAFWLPYWHTTQDNGKTRRKYGQWGPWMDADLFKSLVAQARKEKYLNT